MDLSQLKPLGEVAGIGGIALGARRAPEQQGSAKGSNSRLGRLFVGHLVRLASKMGERSARRPRSRANRNREPGHAQPSIINELPEMHR